MVEERSFWSPRNAEHCRTLENQYTVIVRCHILLLLVPFLSRRPHLRDPSTLTKMDVSFDEVRQDVKALVALL